MFSYFQNNIFVLQLCALYVVCFVGGKVDDMCVDFIHLIYNAIVCRRCVAVHWRVYGQNGRPVIVAITRSAEALVREVFTIGYVPVTSLRYRPLRPVWFGHYGPATMVRPLWSGHYGLHDHYGPVTIVRPLWSESDHYGPTIMVRPLWSGHYGLITMVRPLWFDHYGSATFARPLQPVHNGRHASPRNRNLPAAGTCRCLVTGVAAEMIPADSLYTCKPI